MTVANVTPSSAIIFPESTQQIGPSRRYTLKATCRSLSVGLAYTVNLFDLSMLLPQTTATPGTPSTSAAVAHAAATVATPILPLASPSYPWALPFVGTLPGLIDITTPASTFSTTSTVFATTNCFGGAIGGGLGGIRSGDLPLQSRQSFQSAFTTSNSFSPGLQTQLLSLVLSVREKKQKSMCISATLFSYSLY
ncbi:unnamed protein product [Protopolystoma xenopodis]|uniref:Uncharacterized protein n=1 Tax=Protopolystoma xenopodis TaxID=117903 RepID=A0A448X8N9_9PLAT|nr:unnamed protein product [Protopolystoma xenopodis]